jgi:predicted ATP-grasp superfamily ATP-dependent carboligase
MGEAVVAYVAKNSGVSVEQIKKALGVATTDLQLPIVRMIEAKKLKTTGQKRWRRYFASLAAAEPVSAKPV